MEIGWMEFLKCDAPGCDHRELFEELTQELVGRQCPKCGADLCTQADFDQFVALVRPILRLMEEVGLTEPATAETPADELISLNNHNGQLHIGGLLPTPDPTP